MKNTTILVDPRVIKAIVAVLSKHGVFEEDLRDGIAEVQRRALHWARKTGKPLPCEARQAAALCAKIAKALGTDELRKREIRRQHAELLQRRPAEPWPIERPSVDEGVLDARRKLAVLSEEVLEGRMPAHSEGIIAGLAEGRSQPEIARRLGVSAGVVHHNLAALRERFTERLVQLGMLPPPVAAGGGR